jgi:beta-glucosidase
VGVDHQGVSRRGLAALALGGAAVGLTGCEGKADTELHPKSRQFPERLRLGRGHGGLPDRGLAHRRWARPQHLGHFSRKQPAVDQGRLRTPTVATDSYRRYAEDVDLIAGAGLKAFRFSIAWSRVLPTGEGAVNAAGLDHYERLVDACLAKGITPYATLFHWDLPQALQDKGGWSARDTALSFADYAAAVAGRMGDRLKHFITLNEPAVHTVFGHVLGEHAPG